MFKKNKWEVWYDNLNPSTKAYLKNQAVWHDRDMWKAGLIGCFVGILIGLVV
jgi:hypothetical protein